MKNIKRIVLTGGPGGGKTTTMARLIQFLGERGGESGGIRVVMVPEAATLILTNGVSIGAGGLPLDHFQHAVLKTIIHLEDIMLNNLELMLKNGETGILLCDRGALDCLAYVGTYEFQVIAKKIGKEIGELMNRYDAVIHLRSAACGAEEHYTLANNSARSEDEGLARSRDASVQNAWCGHHHHLIVPANSDFEAKYRQTIGHVCNIIGLPRPLERERKWLVKYRPALDNFPVHHELIEVIQHYLLPTTEGDEERVRIWSYKGVASRFHTIKHEVSYGVRNEDEWRIGESEYELCLKRKDPDCLPIIKSRICFFVGDQRFELDHFRSTDPELNNLMLLEAEVSNINTHVTLPSWLEIEREVTGDSRYSNHELSKFGLSKDVSFYD